MLGRSKTCKCHIKDVTDIHFSSPPYVTALLPYMLTSHSCNQIHKSIAEQFKVAIVYGKSVKHQPQRVGLSHELADEDISKFNASTGDVVHGLPFVTNITRLQSRSSSASCSRQGEGEEIYNAKMSKRMNAIKPQSKRQAPTVVTASVSPFFFI